MKEIELTIIAPMYNEEDNIHSTFESISKVMMDFEYEWELIFVNDGSTDKTYELVNELSLKSSYLKLVSYNDNKGRGFALKTGFKHASGNYIVTIDFDLSYNPEHILKLYSKLKDNTSIDIVLGSAYMKGGRTLGVPFFRLWISKLSNRFFSFFSPQNIKTNTCVLRGYRSQAINSIELNSNGKEIHLEILSKATSLGYNIIEIPATLESRKGGASKFSFMRFLRSHLDYSFFERPAILLGRIGFLSLILGTLIGFYLLNFYFNGNLNAQRPLVTASVILILSGIQLLLFSLITIQLVNLRNEIILIQKQLKR